MSFKYINPGYVGFMHTEEPNYRKANVSPTTSQSGTGVAFYNYDNSYDTSLIHYLPNGAGSEFWFKADIFIPNSSNKLTFRQRYGCGLQFAFYTNSSSDNYLNYFLGNTDYYILRNTSATSLQNESGLKLEAINKIWCHVVLDSSNGYLEFKINSQPIQKYTGNTMPSGTSYTSYYKNLILYSDSANTLFSNIIISDEEISPSERVVLLPVSNTITDMQSLTSGLYVADNAGETLLQSVNTASLIQNYGSDSKITGIALIGNPAYEVDDVIGSLTSLSKKNNTVTDHDTLALSVDTDAMILSSFSMPTDTTVADLSNIQFGWRAEE